MGTLLPASVVDPGRGVVVSVVCTQIIALVHGCHVQGPGELGYCNRFRRYRVLWLELQQTVVQKGTRISLGRVLSLERPRFLSLRQALFFFRFG